MAREMHFGEEELTLKLTGLTAFFAFKRTIVMPYRIIKNVLVDDFLAPLWMLRMPGTSLSLLNIYEGSFKWRNEWYFLSYERREPLLIIELQGHEKYKFIIVQVENPTNVAAEVRGRLK